MKKVGRPKMDSITQRKWWADVKQEDSGGEWDHLLYIGEKPISRYSAPSVTSEHGTRNIRRVLWAAASPTGDLPVAGMEVVPNCGEDNCIQPHHSSLISQSDAAVARRAAMGGKTAISKEMPWLYAGTSGTEFVNFTSPVGKTAAWIAYKWVQMVLTDEGLPEGPIEVTSSDVPDSVRACVFDVWANATFEKYVIGALCSKWIKESFGGASVNVETIRKSVLVDGCHWIHLLDGDENEVWEFELPEDETVGREVPDPSM